MAAVGHAFSDLKIESAELGARGIEIIDGNKLEAADLAQRGIVGVVLGLGRKLDRAYIEALPRLKAIVRYGIGVDNVDVAAATERGIVVCNVPDYCIEEVAVHVLTDALALLRGLSHWDANVRAGAWRSGPRPTMRRISKCTLGIIGYGRIGRSLAQQAQRIFGHILVHDPWYQGSAAPAAANVEFIAELPALLARADVISVHVPLTPETKGMLGASAFAAMKRGAFVLNASRGDIVVESELLDAIRDGQLGGAALDAFSTEPLPKDHPLMRESRVILSPHIAWLSSEAEVDLRQGAASEIGRVLCGEPPRSQVNRV